MAIRITQTDGDSVVAIPVSDALLPALLNVYERLCEGAGSPARYQRRISEVRAAVEAWQMRYGKTVPTAADDPPSVGTHGGEAVRQAGVVD